MTVVVKDPGTRIDFEFEWDEAYPDGQAILASVWTVSPDEASGLVVAAAGNDLIRSTAALAGGIAGPGYRVTHRVTMSDGQIDERSMAVRVEER